MSTLIETPGYDLKKKRRIAPDLPGVPPGHHSGQDVDEVEGPVIEREQGYCVLIIIKLYVSPEVLCFPLQEAWTVKT